MLRVSAVSAVLATWLLAGGVTLSAATSSEPASQAAIVSAVQAPYEAFFRREPAALCASFTPAVASQLVAGAPTGSSCESAVAEVFTQTAPYEPPTPTSWPASWTVGNVVKNGAHALAKVRYSGEGSAVVSLQELAGKWLVSGHAQLVTIAGCTLTGGTKKCSAGTRVMYFFVAPLIGSGPTLPAVPVPTAVKRAGGKTLREFKKGRLVYAQSGCAACHRIGATGNARPGPNLTHVGAQLPSAAIMRAILHPTAPMPSFKGLPHAKLEAIVEFLSQLR